MRASPGGNMGSTMTAAAMMISIAIMTGMGPRSGFDGGGAIFGAVVAVPQR